MKVAILTQYFDPEPITRLNSLVKHLVAAGHTVQVLTALPNWPDGKYYAGYRRALVCEERRLGARVVRSYVWPYRGSTTWKRFANYGSFMLSALWGARQLEPFDLLYVYHPPLTISLPAHLIARRAPVIYDVQDIWPEAGLAANAIRPGFLYRVMTAWARWAYSQAARITVIAPDFVEVLVKQGAAREKICVVSNWADDSLYFPRSPDGVRARWGVPDDAFVVMYAGNLGSTHGVGVILQAAQHLSDRSDIHLVLAGTGAEYEKMVRLKQELGLHNVTFLGYVQPANMPALLAAADLMVIHLRQSDSGAVSLPSRMLAYMACGRPMLVASDGAPRTLVERCECGVACEPENAIALSETIRQLAQQPERLRQLGQNGRQHYLDEFAEETVVRRLIELIEETARNRS